MASESRPERVFWSLSGSPTLIFRVLIVGIMLSTSIGILYALMDRASFVSSFPGAAALTIYMGFLIVAGLGIVSLVGLWMWKRWALALYAILTTASVVLDLLAGAPFAHQLAVIVGAAAVFALAYLNRHRFRGSQPPRAV
jgi:MFS superfamily sulfate permease-like transporter